MRDYETISRNISFVSEDDVFKKFERTPSTKNEDDKENEEAYNAGPSRGGGSAGCWECGEERIAALKRILSKKKLKNPLSNLYILGLYPHKKWARESQLSLVQQKTAYYDVPLSTFIKCGALKQNHPLKHFVCVEAPPQT